MSRTRSYPMISSPLRSSLFVALALGMFLPPSAVVAADADRKSPMPRPRLTEALRAQAGATERSTAASSLVTMDKVVVRGSRLPSGPPKETPRDGKFSLTQGGYVLKERGKTFSTEVGLWRHIDLMESPTEALQQSSRIRMGLLRFSW